MASKSRPEFSIASDAEATPNWISRHMTLMLLRCFLRYSFLAVVSVKSLISPPTFLGAPEYATDSILEIPLLPSSRFFPKVSKPIPRGLMTPTPVMTTRRGESQLRVMVSYETKAKVEVGRLGTRTAGTQRAALWGRTQAVRPRPGLASAQTISRRGRQGRI